MLDGHRIVIDFEPFGLLPIAAPLLALSAHRAACLCFPTRGLERLAATAVLAMGLVHASVGMLGSFGALTSMTLLGLWAATAVALLLATRGRVPIRWPWKATWPALVLSSAVLGIAVVAARLLPIWQWDSIGYHLPFVNFVVQSHGFAEVPPDLRYISTYPHDIELGMIALRVFLPDDRLIDLGQVPYGIAGALITSTIAKRLGATTRLAALAGAAWLTVPCVFLQLPTNYVDVGTAAALLGALFFLLLSPSLGWRELIVGGVSLGLFLGSKPSAPLATVLIGAVVFVRCAKHRTLAGFVVFAALTLMFGAERYVVMWLDHGNPVWPVAVKLGPWTLPGPLGVNQLLAAGAALPSASGSMPERLAFSWFAIHAPPAFDMKIGGLGLPFVLALPFALVALIRRRWPLLVVSVVAALLSPDPSLGRYVLGFAALIIALATVELSAHPRFRGVAAVLIAVVMSAQVVRAWPGLTGDGPTLEKYVSMNDEERRLAVGPHGRPTDYPRAWDAVERGEAAAFDEDFEFPGLLWSPELRYPVYAVPAELSGERLTEWLEAMRIRVVALGPTRSASVAASPSWRRAFDCRSAECAVFIKERGELTSR